MEHDKMLALTDQVVLSLNVILDAIKVVRKEQVEQFDPIIITQASLDSCLKGQNIFLRNLAMQELFKRVIQGRGFLAIDESNATCGKRLTSIRLDNIETNRQAYMLLLTTPGLGDYISGATLFQETIYQSTTNSKKFLDCL